MDKFSTIRSKGIGRPHVTNISLIYHQFFLIYRRYIGDIYRYIGDNAQILVATCASFHALIPVNISLSYRYISDIVRFFPQPTIIGRYRVMMDQHAKYQGYIVNISRHFKHWLRRSVWACTSLDVGVWENKGRLFPCSTMRELG